MATVRDRLPDELTPGTSIRQTFIEEGSKAGSVPAGSTKVGWTIRDTRNRVVDAFAFAINPQGLQYTIGSRASLFATKGGVYVDSFGPGPAGIQLRQLVASGKQIPGLQFTAREDVQRFIKTIYVPATAGDPRARRKVYFHDHHLERGSEQQVYFPPGSLTFERSVELHGVWRFDLQMTSLEKYPFDELVVEYTGNGKNRAYTTIWGDTLQRIAVRISGKGASAKKVAATRAKIIELNPTIKHTYTVKRTGQPDVTVKPLRLVPGVVLRLPT